MTFDEWCKINNKDFKGIDFEINEGTFIQDMYLLSRCNFIVGPLSTFNRWSSFIGDVPLYTIENIDQEITKNDFKIYPYQIVSNNERGNMYEFSNNNNDVLQ